MNYKTIVSTTIISLCIIFVVHLLPNANAITPTSHLIGIQLSQTCITLEKNHMKTSCLTYDKLIPYDNSNNLLSGKWINDTYYHRTVPHVKNGYPRDTPYFVVMVDPDSDFSTHARMIIISDGNFTYVNPTDSIGSNHTRIEYHNRYVNNCMEARVIPDLKWINDTINYLKSGCTITKYKERVLVKTNETPFQYNNPYSSLHYKDMITNLKLHPIKNCINHKCITPPNPYKNPKYGK